MFSQTAPVQGSVRFEPPLPTLIHTLGGSQPAALLISCPWTPVGRFTAAAAALPNPDRARKMSSWMGALGAIYQPLLAGEQVDSL